MATRFGPTIGLALGGGAARGLAHVGVLEELEAHGIRPDLLVGTSMGAIIGALYAAQPDVAALKATIAAYLESESFQQTKFKFIQEKDKVEGEGIFYKFSQLVRKGYFYTSSIARPAFMSEQTLHQNLEELLPDIGLEQTRLPFAAIAMDLASGAECVLRNGSLRSAVAGSCAIPGIFPPVSWNGRQLVDGGWIDAVPVEPAQAMGADVVIAVDVSRDITEFEPPRSGLDIVFRSDAMTRYALARLRMQQADVILEPNSHKVHWADFSQLEDAVQSGRETVRLNIDAIKSIINKRRWQRLLGLSGSFGSAARKNR